MEHGDHDFRHLFDGYSTLVKLQFDDGRIFSGHRLLESDAYKAAKKHKKLCYREFSETPKPTRNTFKLTTLHYICHPEGWPVASSGWSFCAGCRDRRGAVPIKLCADVL
ncbi:Carotenoid cleavage dioxygenase 8 [Cardamine amara subsp. amara]|uniref:Carotenoid cleavage dioxygenase 8 n=1 Tax=Cardamine amara subsp. amara TaxID=228776 RepID=A0ABD1AUC4_CARAN